MQSQTHGRAVSPKLSLWWRLPTTPPPIRVSPRLGLNEYMEGSVGSLRPSGIPCFTAEETEVRGRGSAPARGHPGSNSGAGAGWWFLGLQFCSFLNKEKFSVWQGCGKIASGTVTLENCLAVPLNGNHSFFMTHQFNSWHLPRRNENISTQNKLHRCS